MGLSLTQIFPGAAPSRLQPVAVPDQAPSVSDPLDSTSAHQSSAAPTAHLCPAANSSRALDWQRVLVLAILFIAPVAFILLYRPPEPAAPHELPPAAWAARR